MTATFPYLRKHPDIAAEITALFDATKDRERGSLIKHSEIVAATKIAKDSPVWGRLIQRWKKRMAAKGLWIKSATPRGVGYRVLLVDEQRVEEPMRIQVQAMRRIDKAALCVGCIPVEELNEDGRRFQAVRLLQLGQIKQATQQHRAEVASYLANPKTLPRLRNNGDGT